MTHPFIAGSALFQPGGRLTLTSLTPVTTADVTAAGSVYYTPCVHDQIPIYDGAGFAPRSFVDYLFILDGNSGHTGYHQAGKNYDFFAFDNGGNILFGTGPTWTSDTARGAGAGTTEIELYKGVWVNKNAITLRFNTASGNTTPVAARQATYLGSIRCTADGQTEDSLVKRFVWNCYNRRPRPMAAYETTDSWTYLVAAWRQMNASTANQLNYLAGLAEDAISARALQCCTNASNANKRAVRSGIGVDSVTAPAGLYVGVAADNTQQWQMLSCWEGIPGLGKRTIAALEYGNAAGDNVTFYGDAGGGLQCGIIGSVMA